MHSHDADRILQYSIFIGSFHDECLLRCPCRSLYRRLSPRCGSSWMCMLLATISKVLAHVVIDNHGSFSSQLLSTILLKYLFPTIFRLGCRRFHPPIFEHNLSVFNFRINFGTHHKVLHEFWHPSRRSEPIVHHNLLDLFFIHHDVMNQFSSQTCTKRK